MCRGVFGRCIDQVDGKVGVKGVFGELRRSMWLRKRGGDEKFLRAMW
jgi:hypothetical protein